MKLPFGVDHFESLPNEAPPGAPQNPATKKVAEVRLGLWMCHSILPFWAFLPGEKPSVIGPGSGMGPFPKMAVNFSGEPPEKWLVDRTPHLNLMSTSSGL